MKDQNAKQTLGSQEITLKQAKHAMVEKKHFIVDQLIKQNKNNTTQINDIFEIALDIDDIVSIKKILYSDAELKSLDSSEPGISNFNLKKAIAHPIIRHTVFGRKPDDAIFISKKLTTSYHHIYAREADGNHQRIVNAETQVFLYELYKLKGSSGIKTEKVSIAKELLEADREVKKINVNAYFYAQERRRNLISPPERGIFTTPLITALIDIKDLDFIDLLLERGALLYPRKQHIYETEFYYVRMHRLYLAGSLNNSCAMEYEYVLNYFNKNYAKSSNQNNPSKTADNTSLNIPVGFNYCSQQSGTVSTLISTVPKT